MKQQIYRTGFILMVGVLASCASKGDYDPVIVANGSKSGLENQGLLFNQYNRGQLGGWPQGKRLSRYDVERVRHPEHVHAYHVGRLPSNDRRSMDEAHRVYEIRQDAKWDQRLPVHMMDSTGAVLGVEQPTRHSLSHDARIRAERARQMEISRDLEASRQRINRLEEDLRGKVADYRGSSEVVDGLKKLLKREVTHRKKLENELESAQNKMKDLENQQSSDKNRESLENWR